MSASNDGSESVDQFLARIASLSSKQGTEDAERMRRTEEEMLQARKERQARRAERARSISPVKTGPAASTSLMSANCFGTRSIDPPVSLNPRSQIQTPPRADFNTIRPLSDSPQSSPKPQSSRTLPPTPSDNPTTPTLPPTNAASLSRSGTLSWQQRPLSRESGSVRGRPLSGTRAGFRAPTESPRTSSPEKPTEEPSRKDITASLGAKDPSWFRQTQDRGIGSAAYRKDDSQDLTHEHQSSQGMRLPGMFSEFVTTKSVPFAEREGQRSPYEAASTASKDHVQAMESFRDRDTLRTQDEPNAATSPALKLSSLEAPDLRPHERSGSSDTDGLVNRTSSVLSTSGRPPSPTKGLGGFVQSAMMKRSDSVNKRWSVQANAGLKRGDSVAGSRPNLGTSQSSSLGIGHARNLSREPRSARDGTSSPLSGSRPTSSHGPESNLAHSLATDRAAGLESGAITSGSMKSPTKSAEKLAEDRPSTPPIDDSTARSPSKTLDPRRWSPTKASWLESALSKPESPRPTIVKPEPPAWKLDMQRSKTEKESRPSDNAQTTIFDPVKTAGLLRSPVPKVEVRPHKLGTDPVASQTPKEAVPLATTTSSRKETTPDAPLKPPGLRQHLQMSSIAVDKYKSPSQPSEAEDPEKLPEHENRPELDDKPLGEEQPMDKLVESEMKINFASRTDKMPPVIKPKPQTPPKTDFRASLKSRQTGSANSENKEPEFKAVFGKLKRAQTQNYVAPDELKDNITKGKAALSLTGGPQKTKIVDEFKESILQKKEAMKAGAGTTHKKSDSQSQRNTSPEKPAPEIPEALARRKTLHRTSPSKDGAATNTVSEKSRVTTFDRSETLRPGISTIAKNLSSPAHSTNEVPEMLPRDEKSTSKNSSAELNYNFPKVTNQPSKPVRQALPRELPEISKEEVAPVPRSASPTKEISASSKLAARLNPALAGILSRGGSPKLAEESGLPVGSSLPKNASARNTMQTDDSTQGSGTLTHVTKGRAKGPKRRAPKTEIVPTTISSSSHVRSTTDTPPAIPEKLAARSSASIHTQSLQSPKPALKSTQLPKDAAISLSEPDQRKSIQPQSEAAIIAKEKERPIVAAKSPDLRKVSNPTFVSKDEDKQPLPKPSPPKKFDIATDPGSRETPVTTPRAKDVDAISSRANLAMPLTPSKSKLNSPKQPKPIADSISKAAVVKSETKSNGLGLDLRSNARHNTANSELTPPPDRDFKFSPTHSKNIKSMAHKSDAADTEMMIESFFGTIPKTADRAEFDTEAFLAAQDNKSDKIKTLSNQIWEVNGDGKRSPMPPQQEHVLFEDCMYVCVHSFESTSGSKMSEAYLWCGDAVPEAAVEDAQLFCKKVARENSAKLEVVKQGKEPSNLFQALGGIVVIRKNKSSALYMLCGRRHLGHVAFDEVELASTSLCSGFPFLISAKFGHLYLWKGCGSGADEVGAARLIGMDLGLTGEIEEIAQGEEPAAFWEAFSSTAAKSDFHNSLMWSVKSAPEHRGFPCKLYRVEHERPKSSGGFWGLRASSPPKLSNKASLQEIVPFCQKDLDPNYMHILDAYAKIYILPGAMTTLKHGEFVTALHIAQEIAVLAPSVQDRSLLPVCTIVFGEPPHDFKAAFRKWGPQRNVNWNKQPACVDVAEAIHVLT